MERSVLGLVALTLACASCDSNGASKPAASATPAVTAGPSASTAQSAMPSAVAGGTASAAPSATATSEAEDQCKKHGLTLGGSGTKAEPCKYDNDVLETASLDGIQDEGARISFTNPWDEEVVRLTAAVYYYGKDQKQLALTVNGKEVRAARVEDVAVKLPGRNKTTYINLGPAKKDLPAEADSVEVQVLSFGLDVGDGTIAYFASKTSFKQYRGIHNGDGPTGIAACDSYRQLLESCPKKMPDALTAMRKSLRDYNNTSPETQAKLVDRLTEGCTKGAEAAAKRCTPD
jgi:hypothetical protein